ncbi:hypothetical protein [Lactiplantibacillus paraxiangfangensis]|uniref:hypothetical protein n=1 Tax=Lactiplantibacillus paraxiangfangensis TaxID=3076224 RepID=UPI0030C6C2FE
MNIRKVMTVGTVLLLSITLGACGNNSSSRHSSSSSKSEKVPGPLTKVGTYTKDSKSGKITLMSIKKYQNKKIKTKGATYYFKDAKLLKIETTAKDQRADDASNFGKSLSDTYYEYQLEYSLKNNSKSTVSSNGAELITPQGNQVSSNKGSIDGLVGETIQSGAKKSAILQAIAKKDDIKNLSKYKLVSAELYKNGGNYTVTDKPTTLNFNK